MGNTSAAVPTRDQFVHCHDEHVRWGDMDAFGHVNNVQFFRYLEGARVAYVHAVVGRPLQAAGESVILADQRCTFLRQLVWPGELKVYTRTSRIGRSSLALEQIICRVDAGDADAVAVGQGVMVWFDFDTQRPVPIPDALRQRVAAYERVRPDGA